MLKPGDKAPAFTLEDQNGRLVSLEDFAGRRVVVYFYSRDNTPGCTRQACSFRDSFAGFAARGIPVLGISRDPAKSHAAFAARHGLPFTLLSDPQRTAIEGFGVWQPKTLYGKTSMGVVRSSFVVGPDGAVQKVFPKASPDANAGQLLAWLEENP